ncbi:MULTISPECIES: Alp7A family actin-like protein [Siminovitchia]|uniref:Actin-like protein N-terminal domain-containing protein n=1 Tax=Siminovitchia sediminis TaxID=1274353 RepID=A0ABW4KJN1_9BACI|nr:hypothetical protein [Siminovitchia fortis]
MLAFAFDVGNGFVKAKNGKRTIIAPSTIAKRDSIGTSSIINMATEFDTNSGYNEFESNLDDGEVYIWGDGIKNAVDPDSLIPTYTHHNRYMQKRFKLLCSFILAELASDYEEYELDEVTIVTGVPSQEVGTKESEEFKRFLQQKHVVTRNGVQRMINVVDVRIIEQPLGTLLNEYMNDSGQIHKTLMTSTITVIDFGAGTTIMDTFKNLKRLDDKSETFYEGMNDVHKRIAKRIERENGVKGLDSSFVEEGFKNGTMIAEISERKKYPFEDIAKEIIIDFVEKRISDIDSTLTNRNSIDNFILTGGGVNIVGEHFKKAFNEEALKVVVDSQESNLNGFYKLSSTISANNKPNNKQKLA